MWPPFRAARTAHSQCFPYSMKNSVSLPWESLNFLRMIELLRPTGWGDVLKKWRRVTERNMERGDNFHMCVCPGGAVSQKSHDQLNLFWDGLILKIAMTISSYICIAIAIKWHYPSHSLWGKKNQMPNMLHQGILSWRQSTLLHRTLWIPSFNLNEFWLERELSFTLSILTSALLKWTDLSYLSTEVVSAV